MAEPRPCQVCSHPSRLAIEQALINGKGLLPTARDFRIGSEASGEFRPDHKKVERHRDRCMAEAYHLAREKGEVESGEAIGAAPTYLDEVTREAIERLRLGEVVMFDGVPLLNEDGSQKRRYKDTNLIQAIDAARHNLELRHKIAGSLGGDGDEDALAKARAALESPEARRAVQAVEEVLAQVEAQAGR